MVRLSRIYTKTGDTGTTGLGDGKRVSKDDLRVEAYGTVDEANAAVGVAVTIAAQAAPGSLTARIGDLLRSVQHDLFDVGADLCCPRPKGEKAGERLRVNTEQTQRLEKAIDLHNEDLAPLNSFVLPGGSPLAAAMHVARTVTRRAERCCVTLLAAEPDSTNPETVRYLNRLSDLLFVLSRVANDGGRGDVLWVPGSNRPK
ncbi:MAG: cob(I)yrinic acid a,c-diamide adenosyltransferase [Planctomycetaceae bacterium]|jgi:cob(I)alamin adenosyltransferase|nr:cob(I)yrinic acid a,c-diamide adenosyltransferase [Phycisphaerales bacterium]MCE2653915.1 cob(I)yrinic acid a,c-diamide adenosyltransferase [Planctomycetaceae bacterium]